MAFVWMDILFVELGFCGWDGAEPRHHTGPVTTRALWVALVFTDANASGVLLDLGENGQSQLQSLTPIFERDHGA